MKKLYDNLRLNWPDHAASALAAVAPNAEAHALTNAFWGSELGARLRAATSAREAVGLLHRGSAVTGEILALSAEDLLKSE